MIVAVVIAQINPKKFWDLNSILTPMAQGCVSTVLEHCSANAEAMGSNRVQVPKFFWVNLQ